MTPLYKAAGIRALEARAVSAGEPPLMERAGLAAAELARSLCGDAVKDVLVVAGPGNNGGDAFEVAAHLRRWFYRVSVVFAGDGNRLPGDAAAAYRKWKAADGETLRDVPEGARFGLVVDGLFGIGLARPPEGRHAELVARMNGLGAPILALDVPSGLNADTGAVLGAAVRASHTITFIAGKPGLYTLDGPDHCGEVHIATLGLEAEALAEPEGRLLGRSALRGLLPRRPRNFHKGRAGSVGILGGASGMVGAALMAGRAALKCGAGRTYVGLLANDRPALDTGQPELMLRPYRGVLADGLAGVLVAGPGMGATAAAARALLPVLRAGVPVVLDADGLNLVAAHRTLAQAMSRRRAPTIVTPHPAEAARLLGTDTAAVQADRVASARRISERYRAAVVLKGNGSIVAAPDGKWWINTSGNPGMASAGMGDVLAGIVAALIAQGVEPVRALLGAVHLHGAAADALAARGIGPVGLTATETIDAARALLNAGETA